MNKVEMLIYALDQMKSSHSAVGVEFNGSSDAFDEFYGIKTPTQMKAFVESHKVECRLDTAKCEYDRDTYVIDVN